MIADMKYLSKYKVDMKRYYLKVYLKKLHLFFRNDFDIQTCSPLNLILFVNALVSNILVRRIQWKNHLNIESLLIFLSTSTFDYWQKKNKRLFFSNFNFSVGISLSLDV